MFWVGLTGGIATGKSSVAKILREMGHPVVDADELAREVVCVGSPGLSSVVQAFGREVLESNGELNRGALGKIIFADDTARDRLEKILHPLIQDLRARERLKIERSGAALAFYDVPLLFEKNMSGEFDSVVLVYASSVVQRARLRERNGMSDDEIDRRLSSQLPIDSKMKLADYVIFNEAGPGELRKAVEMVVAELLAK